MPPSGPRQDVSTGQKRNGDERGHDDGSPRRGTCEHHQTGRRSGSGEAGPAAEAHDPCLVSIGTDPHQRTRSRRRRPDDLGDHLDVDRTDRPETAVAAPPGDGAPDPGGGVGPAPRTQRTVTAAIAGQTVDRGQPRLDPVECFVDGERYVTLDEHVGRTDESVESSPLGHDDREPFDRQRVTDRVGVDADVGGGGDQRLWFESWIVGTVRRLDRVRPRQDPLHRLAIQSFGHPNQDMLLPMSPDPAHPGPSPATRAITAGREASGRSLAPALWATSTWESESLDDAHRRATSVRHGDFYSRYGNPTVRSFEQAMSELEGAEESLAFASGMGAIASTVLALCSTGSHVVAQRQLYAGTLAFLQGPCARWGIETTFVDVTVPGSFADAVVPGRTMLVIAETPSNPRLELADMDELGAIRGPFTLVDSTFATPLGQRPLDHGVDISLHSATKGIAGHNDATLGVISGEADLLAEIWAYAVLHGATPSPFDALNALRGIRTLGVRTRQQNDSARSLAVLLADHPHVAATHYPGLSEHPQHELANRQLLQYGTVLSFDLGTRDAAASFLDRVALCRVATSLGGPETLVCHPATSTHASLTPDEQAATGVTPGLIRLSVGLEETVDLLADVEQALT